MSAEGPVHAQQQSRLVRLPVELRRHIYGYIVPAQVHLYHDQGNICAATCITPTAGNDYYCFDRRSAGDPSTAVWARRLGSSWGGHWRCEEVAKRLHLDMPDTQTQHDSTMALMALCRKTFQDVACLLADTCVIHVNELATLGLLFHQRDTSLRSRSPGHLLTQAFFDARRVSLSLRLPMAIYKAIATKPSATKAVTSSPSPSSASIAWNRLWHNMTALQHLQRFDVTLDHDSASSWSVVDEHAILAPSQSLASHAAVKTTMHVPKVASARRDDTWLGLAMKRFTRQRFFTEYRKDGSIGLVYEEDAYRSFHRPGPGAAEALRAAELTMHVWFQGVELDYMAMDDDDAGCAVL